MTKKANHTRQDNKDCYRTSPVQCGNTVNVRDQQRTAPEKGKGKGKRKGKGRKVLCVVHLKKKRREETIWQKKTVGPRGAARRLSSLSSQPQKGTIIKITKASARKRFSDIFFFFFFFFHQNRLPSHTQRRHRHRHRHPSVER